MNKVHQKGNYQTTDSFSRTSNKKYWQNRQLLWLSWQSGLFHHLRSAVQIQSMANFMLSIVYCIEKIKIKKKRPGMDHFQKEDITCRQSTFQTTLDVAMEKYTEDIQLTFHLHIKSLCRAIQPLTISRITCRQVSRYVQTHFEIFHFGILIIYLQIDTNNTMVKKAFKAKHICVH